MSLTLRGINYDVGTRYDTGDGPGRLSTHRYDIDGHLRRDMDVIAAELHCNAVQLYGTDVDRLMVAASLALERGLSPWIQPRLIGADPSRPAGPPPTSRSRRRAAPSPVWSSHSQRRCRAEPVHVRDR